jgi:hypothetical protein
MTEPIPPSPNPPAKNTRRLPSLRVRAVLTAGLFALGIVVGAAIGPAPQNSMAGAAVNPRALIASLLARDAASAHATPTPTPTDAAPAAKTAPVSPSAAAPATSAGTSGSSSTPAPVTPASASTPSTTPSTTPSNGASGTSSPDGSTGPLPAIGHVWLILLPGEGMASAVAQPANDPYLAQQLIPEGTLLKSYSSLAASALVSDAALLSGQSVPQESVLSAPACNTAAQPTCTPGSAVQLADVDGWLHQLIPQITASADYRHGLIALAFTAPGEGAATPTAGTTTSASASTATTLAAQPVGVLLLSPFLRKPGGQSTTPFHPATPRKNLEGLLRA